VVIYLVDIDGTVADASHRLHFIQTKPADWKSFYEACTDDLPIYNVITIIRLLRRSGATVIAVTGRSDEIKKQTDAWLLDFGVCPNALYMRKKGDHREDYVVKEEILNQIKLDWPKEDIVGVFEDRQQVVDMYRAKGLTVFQVAPGNF
jgi:HAD superfamily, subfamily IIIB (Acid phosphatase)